MPEMTKGSQSASPVARAGGGDISERELTRERYTLQTTPPARVQPAHPKKQLFSAPVSKFTAVAAPSHLARIRSCLDEYSRPTTPARPVKAAPKAVSMEDLTPSKKRKQESKDGIPSNQQLTLTQQQAAARITRVVMLHAWRRRRDEVRCLRKTLTFQVSCSERLRVQVHTLKSLLDSDNAKVRLAMRELQRLKQLLTEREAEKAVLEREKAALEGDIIAAEDRASEMSIGWRNCRNELEGARSAAMAAEHALAAQRAAAAQARHERDQAYDRLSELEDEIAQQSSLLSSAEVEVEVLQREAGERARLLEAATLQLQLENRARESVSRECSSLNGRLSSAVAEAAALRLAAAALREELRAARAELAAAREQLAWWPRPLTRMMGAARALLRGRMSLPDAVVWSLVPARHGC